MTPETPSPSVTTVGERRDAIARIIDPNAWETAKSYWEYVAAWAVAANKTDKTKLAMSRRYQAFGDTKVAPSRAKADAILSLESPARVTGEGCAWRPIRDAERINGHRLVLMWDDCPSLSAHWETGWWTDGKGWVNTYGHAFSGEPTHFFDPDALPSTPTANAPVSDVGSEQRARELLEHEIAAAHLNEHVIEVFAQTKTYQCALRAIQAALPPHSDIEGLEALTRIDQFVTKYREPWGAWKTAWWEDEVSDDAAFTADNALMHVANIARTVLGGL